MILNKLKELEIYKKADNKVFHTYMFEFEIEKYIYKKIIRKGIIKSNGKTRYNFFSERDIKLLYGKKKKLDYRNKIQDLSNHKYIYFCSLYTNGGYINEKWFIRKVNINNSNSLDLDKGFDNKEEYQNYLKEHEYDYIIFEDTQVSKLIEKSNNIWKKAFEIFITAIITAIVVKYIS